MKLLLVTDVFPPGSGGSGESTAALAAALKRRAHEPIVLSLSNQSGEREWSGVRVVDVERGEKRHTVSRFAKKIAELVEREQLELIHAQHWRSMASAVKASTGLPIVVTVRDYWPVCQWSTKMSGRMSCPGCTYWNRLRCVSRNRPRLTPLAALLPPVIGLSLNQRQRLLNKAQAVIAVSESVAGELPSSSHVIPNLVDLQGLNAQMETAESEELPERFALFVGKLEPNKAADRLVPIYEASKLTIPLLIAGTGSLEPEIRAQVERSGKDIRVLGWVAAERLRSWMRAAELVVFPSRWDEPLSRVLLEALGVGAVVIAEPTGGTPEIIVDGESGLLASGDRSLGEAMLRAGTDSELAERLRRGAKERVRAKFSETVVIPKLEAVYRRVVDEAQ